MKTKELTRATLLISSTLFISSTLALFTACTADEAPLTPKEKTPVTINPTIAGEVVTKTEDSDYQPTDGDKKIFMYYKDGSNTEEKETGKYVYNSGWAADTDGDMYWDNLVNQGTGTAKYPFFAISPKELTDRSKGAVMQDQSATGALTNSDLLMAYTEVTTQRDKVGLTFKHMLAKLTVKINVSSLKDFNKSEVTITNVIKDYTVAYTNPSTATPASITTATISGGGSSSNKVDGNFNSISTKSDGSNISAVTITPLKITPVAPSSSPMKVNLRTGASDSEVIEEYSAILPAQSISSDAAKIKIEITVGQNSPTETNTYTYAPASGSSLTLTNGTHTTLTLTIKGTKVELENIKVTPWTEETDKTGDITIDTPANPTT